MTANQIAAATKAIRKMIDEQAGWYAHLVKDEHCQELAIAALTAAEAEGKIQNATQSAPHAG